MTTWSPEPGTFPPAQVPGLLQSPDWAERTSPVGTNVVAPFEMALVSSASSVVQILK